MEAAKEMKFDNGSLGDEDDAQALSTYTHSAEKVRDTTLDNEN